MQDLRSITAFGNNDDPRAVFKTPNVEDASLWALYEYVLNGWSRFKNAAHVEGLGARVEVSSATQWLA